MSRRNIREELEQNGREILHLYEQLNAPPVAHTIEHNFVVAGQQQQHVPKEYDVFYGLHAQNRTMGSKVWDTVREQKAPSTLIKEGVRLSDWKKELHESLIEVYGREVPEPTFWIPVDKVKEESNKYSFPIGDLSNICIFRIGKGKGKHTKEPRSFCHATDKWILEDNRVRKDAKKKRHASDSEDDAVGSLQSVSLDGGGSHDHSAFDVHSMFEDSVRAGIRGLSFTEKDHKQLRDEIKALETTEDCKEFYDDHPDYKACLGALRRFQTSFVGFPQENLYNKRTRLAKLFGQALCLDDKRAKSLNHCRKTCLTLLYKVCKVCPRGETEDTRRMQQMKDIFQVRRTSDIVSLCLPLDRANCLYNMMITTTGERGLGWYAEGQEKDYTTLRTPPLPLNPLDHSINKCFKWLQEANFFESDPLLSDWMNKWLEIRAPLRFRCDTLAERWLAE